MNFWEQNYFHFYLRKIDYNFLYRLNLGAILILVGISRIQCSLES
jgi:hypothetical protein